MGAFNGDTRSLGHGACGKQIKQTLCCASRFRAYLEGQGDLVSRLITPITQIVTLVITVINPLTKSP